MKAISKKSLDEVIRLTRKYYKTSDTDILDARYNSAKLLSNDAFGHECGAYSFIDVVGAILSGNGLKRNATNQDIYDVFALIGYDVREDSERYP